MEEDDVLAYDGWPATGLRVCEAVVGPVDGPGVSLGGRGTGEAMFAADFDASDQGRMKRIRAL